MRTIIKALVCASAVIGFTLAHLMAQSLVANAGPDQSGMFVGTTVNLTGTASVGATSYTWSFSKRPSGSSAVLVNPTSATPTFVPDRGGAYTLRLVVGNGTTTASDTVVITTGNRPPTANAGADASATVGKSVALNGTASSDLDLNKLTYQWTLISRPPASVAALTKATSSKPSLFVDRPGSYVARLVVKDGTLLSAPDEVVITTSNTLPVAAAGPDRQVGVGSVVTLDATASSDVDEDTLTYTWTLKRPSGSTAVLDDPTSPLPSFLPNVAGSYTATLRVGDGVATKTDSVVITTNANRAPVARTGADDRSLVLGQAVQFDASTTTDANGQLLTYLWTVTKRPSGSSAPLVGGGTPRPTFTADKAGNYTFSLSATDTGGQVGIDTQILGTALPQADAGLDQVVTVGNDVALDGSRSSHLNGTLAFGWALISTPDGSTAALDSPGDPQPHFTADLEGTYIAQLIVFDGARLSLADTVVVTTGGNLPPRVDLGSDRLVSPNSVVTVDAVATDPNLDPLTYAWALLGRPAGSGAAVSGASGASVQITPDVAGDYIVQLVATDPGGLSAVGTLVLTSANTEPRVSVGEDRMVASGAMVELDAMSDDPDGGALTYRWSVLTKPTGSTATLSDPAVQDPSFIADVDGVYVVQVVVRDQAGLQAVDAVVLRSGAGGAPPVADAGSGDTVAPGTLVQLDGTASSDPEGEPLTYAWQIVSKPGGSAAALSDPASSQPTVTVDLPGAYVFELLVNDGVQDSEPSQVTITVNGPPVAEAGADQAVDTGSPVSLNGSASTDPEGQPLTYTWSVVLKPGGSSATPVPPGSATPTFTPDMAGVYVLQLVVNDGFSDSLADTVTISTRRTPSISPTSVSLTPGNSSVLTVSVPYATGNALELQLSSSNTGVATVPATVTIPANQTSATFTVTAGNTNGGAIVKATAPGVGTGETSVAVGVRLARWVQDASGAWETPGNWSDNAVPGVGDVVVIDRPAGNFVVTIGAPTAAVASLLSRESLNVFSTLTVDGPAAFDGAVNLTSTLAGSGSAMVNAPMTWTSGVVSLAGGLEVLTGRTLTFPSNGVGRALINSSVTNHGTVAMGQGNSVTLQAPATVTNAADGLWEMGDGTFGSNGAGALTVANAGTWRKTSGAGVMWFAGGAAYSNTGTIEVQSGSARVTGDGAAATLSNAGQLKVSAGAVFELHGVTLNAGTSFAGAGTLALNNTTTVTADVTVTLPTTLTGTVTGSGTVRMGAPLTWTSGVVSLAGGLEVLTGQTLTFPSNGVGRALINSSVTNHGTVAMGQGNSVTLQAPATVTNAADGLWEMGDGTFGSNGAGALTVANAGTWRKTSGSGAMWFAGHVAYSNTGTIEVQSGSARVTGDGAAATLSNAGQLKVSAGAVFELHGVTLQAGTSFAGAGTLALNNTTTVTADVTVTLPTILTGTLTGSGTVRMGAPLTWTGGVVSLAGGLEVLTGQTLTFPSNGVGRALINSSVTNHGTVAMGQGNSVTLQAPATVTNAADGLWEMGDGTFGSNGAGALTVANAGTWRKTSGSGAMWFAGHVAYSNTGTIEVQSGSARVTGDGAAATLSNAGQLKVSAGAVFELHGVTLQAGTSFAGAGTLALNNTTTVTADVTVTLPTILTGTLTGSGTVRMGAPLTWTGGVVSLAGGLEVLTGQTLTFPSNGVGRALINSSVTNHGTVAMGQGNSVTLQAPATVTNAADGLWEMGDGTFGSNGAGALTVANAGTWRKTSGSGAMWFAGHVAYSNTGTIEVQSGSARVTGDGAAATLSNAGQLKVSAGAVFELHGVTLQAGTSFAGAGTLAMNNTTTVTALVTVTLPTTLTGTVTGSGTVRMGAPLTWTSGVVSLAGGLEVLAGQTLTFPSNGVGRALINASLTNHGTVSWDGGGSLVYQGGNMSVINAGDGVWTFGAGTFALTSNGQSNPPGTFTFLNLGAMTGAGTTLNVHSFNSFSNSGTISGITVVFVP